MWKKNTRAISEGSAKLRDRRSYTGDAEEKRERPPAIRGGCAALSCILASRAVPGPGRRLHKRSQNEPSQKAEKRMGTITRWKSVLRKEEEKCNSERGEERSWSQNKTRKFCMFSRRYVQILKKDGMKVYNWKKETRKPSRGRWLESQTSQGLHCVGRYEQLYRLFHSNVNRLYTADVYT